MRGTEQETLAIQYILGSTSKSLVIKHCVLKSTLFLFNNHFLSVQDSFEIKSILYIVTCYKALVTKRSRKLRHSSEKFPLFLFNNHFLSVQESFGIKLFLIIHSKFLRCIEEPKK